MTVSREDLERFIADLERQIPDRAAGIHGPSSLVWDVDKEAVLFLGGGRAALLQLAHPFVAHAVDAHSATKSDPLGRFQRTFENVFAMVFGDLDRAIRSARRVHTIHTRIHGTIDEDVGAFRRGDAYQANDEEALLWVYATLVDTAILVHDLVVRRLSREEKEEYYEEGKRFARLFGISDRVLPASYAAFQAYFAGMLASRTIAVGRPAREIGRFLFTPRRRGYEPFVRWIELMTAGLMPDRLRDEFGLPWGRARGLAFDASIAALRASVPFLPTSLRVQPAYAAAKRRLAGLPPSTTTSEWVEHVTQGLLSQAPLRALVRRPARGST